MPFLSTFIDLLKGLWFIEQFTIRCIDLGLYVIFQKGVDYFEIEHKHANFGRRCSTPLNLIMAFSPNLHMNCVHGRTRYLRYVNCKLRYIPSTTEIVITRLIIPLNLFLLEHL